MPLVRWVWWCSGVGVLAGPTILGLGITGSGRAVLIVAVFTVLSLGFAGSLLVGGDDAPLAAMLGPFAASVAGWISFLVSLASLVCVRREL